MGNGVSQGGYAQGKRKDDCNEVGHRERRSKKAKRDEDERKLGVAEVTHIGMMRERRAMSEGLPSRHCSLVSDRAF
jgi:hypothetical protein